MDVRERRCWESKVKTAPPSPSEHPPPLAPNSRIRSSRTWNARSSRSGLAGRERAARRAAKAWSSVASRGVPGLAAARPNRCRSVSTIAAASSATSCAHAPAAPTTSARPAQSIPAQKPSVNCASTRTGRAARRTAVSAAPKHSWAARRSRRIRPRCTSGTCHRRRPPAAAGSPAASPISTPAVAHGGVGFGGASHLAERVSPTDGPPARGAEGRERRSEASLTPPRGRPPGPGRPGLAPARPRAPPTPPTAAAARPAAAAAAFRKRGEGGVLVSVS